VNTGTWVVTHLGLRATVPALRICLRCHVQCTRAVLAVKPVNHAGSRHPQALLRAAVVGLVVLLAACGSTPPGEGGTTKFGGTSSAAPIYEVRTSAVAGIGRVLVDGQGLTLYLFEPDKQSDHSTCNGICAAGWPPLLLPAGVTRPLASAAIDAGLLGTTTRKDGTTQVTYNGWPLYLWNNDSAPGEATGQGLDNLGGIWWAVSPNGQADHIRP
jgi:predicted lipoprotein with Yx(FWY)xxD motif